MEDHPLIIVDHGTHSATPRLLSILLIWKHMRYHADKAEHKKRLAEGE